MGVGGSVNLSEAPSDYVPGAVYTLMVQVAMPGQQRWGFEATALKTDGKGAGDLIVTNAANTRLKVDAARSRTYIEQTRPGTMAGQKDVGPVFRFDWKAPDAGSGPVTFYAAGNAANGDGATSGDFIFTTSAFPGRAAYPRPR